jgi:hypothetical protein
VSAAAAVAAGCPQAYAWAQQLERHGNCTHSRPQETIKKENKIQRKHLEHEVAAGRIPAYNPPSPPPPLSVLDQVGLPAFTRAAKRDPELVMGTTMSKSIWTCNPGYVLRDGARMASTTHSDYVWDDEAVRRAGQAGSRRGGVRTRW